jgi:hypothetical protein
MRKVMALAVAILIVLAGCGKKVDPYPITDKQFKTGSDGLVYKFLPNGPPDKLFEESTFEIASEIWNKGAYPVTEGYATAIVENAYMCVTSGDTCAQVSDEGSYLKLLRDNIDKIRQERAALELSGDVGSDAYLQLTEDLRRAEEQLKIDEPKAANFNDELTKSITNSNSGGPLYGKRLESPQGNANALVFKARAKKLDVLTVEHTSPVILTTCYGYRTELAETVCIDPDTSATTLGPKACQMKDLTFSDQGAPVAIGKLETRVLPDNENAKPQFIIYVRNVNKGEVISEYKLKQACSAAKLAYSDIGVVRLADFRFGDYSYANSTEDTMECKPNPLRLRGVADDYIRCSIKEGQTGISRTRPAYTTQVFVNLTYGYMQSASKQVVIEKAR